MPASYTLTLHRWTSTTGILGPRYTLMYEGKAVITRGTELEARQYAKSMGWTVKREEDT